MDTNLLLSLLPETMAICRLGPDEEIPEWCSSGPFQSMTRTPDEVSIVCDASTVPDTVACTRDWRCLKVDGPLDFSLIGILASLTSALARAGISVFAISTFDTDYLFVREGDLERAVAALESAGHRLRTA